MCYRCVSTGNDGGLCGDEVGDLGYEPLDRHMVDCSQGLPGRDDGSCWKIKDVTTLFGQKIVSGEKQLNFFLSCCTYGHKLYTTNFIMKKLTKELYAQHCG